MAIETKLIPRSPTKPMVAGISASDHKVVIVVARDFYNVGRKAAVTTVSADSFGELAQAMFAANADAATVAFGKAVATINKENGVQNV